MIAQRRFAASRPVVLIAAVVIGAGLACFTPRPRPRFGSLVPEARSFAMVDPTVRVQLDNGLTAALAPDPRTNLVTVDVRYRVGMIEDPVGQEGLAHLVEHLTFNERATLDGPTLYDELGDRALEWNAWTTPETTHYTATARPEELDALLALEARRMAMATACDRLDQATFARERTVVLAEVADRTDPLAPLRAELLAAVYGATHPYVRAGAAAIADATRDDACQFLAAHYAPERAVVVITGAIDTAAASAAVRRAFDPLHHRAGGARVEVAAPSLRGTRSRHRAPIQHATAIVFLAHPPVGTAAALVADTAELMLAGVLDEADRDQAWVKGTAVEVAGGRAAPVVAVAVAVDDPGRLEDAVDLVYASLRTIGRGDEDDLKKIRNARAERQLALVVAWDDAGRRGDQLADYLVDPRGATSPVRDVDTIAGTDLAALRAATAPLTADHSHEALIEPSPAPPRAERASATAGATHDLRPWRSPVDPAEAARPLVAGPTGYAERISQWQLANGLRVVLAPDPHSPIVDARLVFAVGSGHDDPARPGVAHLAAGLLEPDVERLFTHREIALLTWGVGRGTEVGHQVDETTTTFAARGLAIYADWHVWRLAWLIEQGGYRGDTLDRARDRLRDRADDADRADAMRAVAVARFRERLFGRGHPFTGADDPRALLAIGRGALDRWRADHYRPDGATLVVSGGFDPVTMRREIEELFGPWSSALGPPPPSIPPLAPAPGPSWLAVSDDALVRPRLTIAFATRSDPIADEAARLVLVAMLQERVWAVRAGMGATYGISVGYRHGDGGRALTITGTVDPARAGDVLVRLLADVVVVRGWSGPAPSGTVSAPALPDRDDDTTADFIRARRRVLARALARSGGATATGDLLHRLAISRQPIERLDRLASEIAALTPAAVAAVARADLAHVRMVVEVAGPAKIIAATYAVVGNEPE